MIYLTIEQFVKVTPLRHFGARLWAAAGTLPMLTAGEVSLSMTHLEFSYTQAPKKIKSLVMCTYLGTISLVNVFSAAVNFFIQNPDGSVKLNGAAYFYFLLP